MKTTLLDKVSTEALEELLSALKGAVDEMKTAVPENSKRYSSEVYAGCLSLTVEVLTALRHQELEKKVLKCETLAYIKHCPSTQKHNGLQGF